MSLPDMTAEDLAREEQEFREARKDLMLLGFEQSRTEAIAAVARVVDEADDLGDLGVKKIEAVANDLQNRRAFGLLLVLCILANRAGVSSATVRQKEVQALIELGRLGEAVRRAKALAATVRYAAPESDDFGVWKSALGNIGRAHKQAYVDAAMALEAARGKSEAAHLKRPSAVDLEQAVEVYTSVWDRTVEIQASDPSAKAPSTYHAINAAALIMRASRDREAGAEDPDALAWASEETARALADEILRIEEPALTRALNEAPKGGDMWTLATCGEAYLVLGFDKDAAVCYGAYAGNPDNDAFKLASSLRQLEEVWGISGDQDGDRGKIVRILKAALLNIQGGNRSDGTPIAAEDEIQSKPVLLSPKEAGLIRKDLEEQTREKPRDPTDGFQRFFETNDPSNLQGRMVAMKRLLRVVNRVGSICAIQSIEDGEWTQVGSGFIIDGGVFHDDWAGEALIATNHHVVGGADGAMGASYMRCRALFYDYEPDDSTVLTRQVEFDSIAWSSPPLKYDTTLLRPKGDLPAGVTPLGKDDTRDYLPPRADVKTDGCNHKVVVLGFPLGGEPKFSFDDELLLDHSAGEPGGPVLGPDQLDGMAAVKLHYRTPTEPGSSGSPVFDSASMDLIGIHHMGGTSMRRIPSKQGTYEANIGVWLPSIRARIRRDLEEAAVAASRGDTAPADDALASSGAAPSSEFLGITSRVASVIGGTDFPSASASSAPASPSDEVVLGKTLSPPGSSEPAAPPKALLVPGRRISRPEDDPALIARHLRTGVYSGDLEKFRLQGAGFETVIGNDDRTRIEATSAYPFRMICSLTMHWDGGAQTVGTGFLVGQRTVVTAGHCILPSRGSPYPTGIEIRPGRSGHHEPFAHFGQLYAEKVSIHREWSNRFDPRFDVGALHLNREIGEELGWFRVAARDPKDLERRWVHVTGYPGDKLTPLPASQGGGQLHAAELWHHATPVETVHDGRVFYPADTFGGQSGSPVYTFDEDGVATVVGVHAYGTGQGEHAYENNSAGWVDASLLQIISDWRTL